MRLALAARKPLIITTVLLLLTALVAATDVYLYYYRAPHYSESISSCVYTIQYGGPVCTNANFTIVSSTQMNLFVSGSTNDTSIQLVSYTVNTINMSSQVDRTFRSPSGWSGVTVPNGSASTTVVLDITGASFEFGPGGRYSVDLVSANRTLFVIDVRT